jgi:hypothetical protein
MVWQLIIVGILVAAAGLYVVRMTWQTWHPPKGSCGGGCGCAPKTTASQESEPMLIPTEELTLRRPVS